ncbi:MAG: hypothetical protein ABI889_00855, partial [Gemmatimonadota bacterium]
QPSDELQSARHVERERDYRFGAIAALALTFRFSATSKITDVPTPTPASGLYGRVVAPDLSVRCAVREPD